MESYCSAYLHNHVHTSTHAHSHVHKFYLSPDAHRKEQRKKEVNRNKLERKYTREACSNRDKPEQIREQLQELITSGEVVCECLRAMHPVVWLLHRTQKQTNMRTTYTFTHTRAHALTCVQKHMQTRRGGWAPEQSTAPEEACAAGSIRACAAEKKGGPC
jgi:hypothetical protein